MKSSYNHINSKLSNKESKKIDNFEKTKLELRIKSPILALSINVQKLSNPSQSTLVKSLSNSSLNNLEALLSPKIKEILKKSKHKSKMYQKANREKHKWIKAIECDFSEGEIDSNQVAKHYATMQKNFFNHHNHLSLFTNNINKLNEEKNVIQGSDFLQINYSSISKKSEEFEKKKLKLEEMRKELYEIELMQSNSNSNEMKIKNFHFSIPDLKTEFSKISSDFGMHSNENLTPQRSFEFIKRPINSSFSKKSLTFRKQNFNKDPAIIIKLKNTVGISMSRNIRMIFEKFSSEENYKYMSYLNFKKFLISFNLKEKKNIVGQFIDDTKNNKYTKYIKKGTAHIYKKIDFVQFIEILFVYASDYYPEIQPKEFALDKFIRLNILENAQKQGYIFDPDLTLTKWACIINNEDTKEYVKTNENFFLKLFDAYKSIDANEGYHITYTDYLKMCKDRKIYPFLMSNREIEAIYKYAHQSCTKALILNFLTYEDFINSILLIPLVFFEKNKNSSNDTNLQKIEKVINYMKI